MAAIRIQCTSADLASLKDRSSLCPSCLCGEQFLIPTEGELRLRRWPQSESNAHPLTSLHPKTALLRVLLCLCGEQFLYSYLGRAAAPTMAAISTARCS